MYTFLPVNVVAMRRETRRWWRFLVELRRSRRRRVLHVKRFYFYFSNVWRERDVYVLYVHMCGKRGVSSNVTKKILNATECVTTVNGKVVAFFLMQQGDSMTRLVSENDEKHDHRRITCSNMTYFVIMEIAWKGISDDLWCFVAVVSGVQGNGNVQEILQNRQGNGTSL